MIDTFGRDADLRSIIDNLFDREHASLSIQEYRNTILGLIKTLPNELRSFIHEEMDSEAIALRLNLAVDEEHISEMKEEIRRAVNGNIDDALSGLNLRDLTLAYDVALNINAANRTVTWDNLELQMDSVRLQFDTATVSAEHLTNAISELSSRMRLLHSAQNEMAVRGGLPFDDVMSLIDKLGDDYYNYLILIGNQIKLNTEEYRRFALQEQEAHLQRLQNQRELYAHNLRLAEANRPDPNDRARFTNQVWNDGMPDANGNIFSYEPWTQALANWRDEVSRAEKELAQFDERIALHEHLIQMAKTGAINYSDTVNQMNTSISLSQTAINEMNQQGHISWETFSRLAEVTPNVADYITTINGRLVLNTQAWNQNETATALALQALREYTATLPPWNERTQGQIQLMHYLYEQYERLRTGVLTATEIMAQAVETTDSLSSAYTSLTSAIEEFNEYGNLQIGTVQRLLAMGEEYLDLLEFSEGKLILNTVAIDLKVQALREEMIASQQAALAEEIRAIIQEDTRKKTEELSNSTDHARERLIRIGRQALSTAEDFGVLTAAMQAANQMMLTGEHGDLGHLSEQAMANIDEAFRRHQRNIDIINSMVPGASNNFPRGSTPSRSTSSSGGGDPWREQAEREITELRWLHDMRLISEETFLNRLDALNRRFFANRAEYLDEWRRLELEVVNGVRRVWEENANLQLTRAREFMDFDRQIELYRKFQDDLHEQANRFRNLGFEETSNEILELGNQWQDFQNNIFAATRESLEVRLSVAMEHFDFEAQLAIYREFQETALEEANRFREMGATADSLRIQQLEQQYRAYAARIVDVFNEKFQQERDAFNRHFSQLEFRLSIRSCLVSTKNERNEGNGGHLKVVEG